MFINVIFSYVCERYIDMGMSSSASYSKDSKMSTDCSFIYLSEISDDVQWARSRLLSEMI